MNRVLEVVLCLTIASSVIAFGGVQPLAYSLMEASLFATFLAMLLRQTQKGQIRLLLPLWPGLFALLVLLQVVPLPAELVTKVSPGRLPDFSLAGLLPQHPTWTTLSIYPHDTLVSLVRLLAYLCAFSLAANLFDSGTRKSLLVLVLAGLGFLEAAYGMIQYLTHTERVLGYKKVFYLGVATGTYINHNHYAGFLEMTLPFLVGYVFYTFQLRTETSHDRSRKARASRGRLTGRLIFLFFLSAIVVTGVIFSFSRGGILATAVSVLFIGLLSGLRTRRKAWIIGVFAFLLCAVGYGMWIGVGPVVERFAQIRETNYLQMEGRVSFWKDSMSIIKAHPLAGTGLGTFGLSFRRHQTTWVSSFVDHAHNDYVELTCDTGWLGVSLLFLPIWFLMGKMVHSFVTETRRFRSAVTLGCIGSALALLLHSITDFNLQIPANALVLAVVLGIGYKAACVERAEESKLPLKAQPARVLATQRLQ